MTEKKCDQCGNKYSEDKTLQIKYKGADYNFDSFECAFHKLAPECKSCGLQIIGHGVSKDSVIYCCENCLTQ